MFLCLFRASESSQQRQGARRAEETGRLAVDVYFRYISYQTRVIALPGPPDPWAATAKIGSSAWAEGRVSLLSSGRARVGRRRRGEALEETIFLPRDAPSTSSLALATATLFPFCDIADGEEEGDENGEEGKHWRNRKKTTSVSGQGSG
ncbi:hypothetical protein Taro_045031 [Colocasia esculenta]|uniref:Uncharacterized protein n=1 Tax=Colocasia esculenta TaxID=4460 RepID=A0A843WVI6_COLES|nr:hypothetical protein [Colocasia esculenta]